MTSVTPQKAVRRLKSTQFNPSRTDFARNI
jgi:hypothetical protein